MIYLSNICSGILYNTWWNRGTFDQSSHGAIAQVYLDITGALQPDLTVIDFSIGLDGDGPTRDQGGNTVDMKENIGSWAILASTDIMAADATAARMMDHDVEKVKQLTMGLKLLAASGEESSIHFLSQRCSLTPPQAAGNRACELGAANARAGFRT